MSEYMLPCRIQQQNTPGVPPPGCQTRVDTLFLCRRPRGSLITARGRSVATIGRPAAQILPWPARNARAHVLYPVIFFHQLLRGVASIKADPRRLWCRSSLPSDPPPTRLSRSRSSRLRRLRCSSISSAAASPVLARRLARRASRRACSSSLGGGGASECSFTHEDVPEWGQADASILSRLLLLRGSAVSSADMYGLRLLRRL